MTDWKSELYKIIFEADTPKGRAFDIALIIAIVCSSLVVVLDSVERLNQAYSSVFFILEWFWVALFTTEYILRIVCVHNRFRYITSFFGIVDLMAILPSFLGIVFPEAQTFIVIRLLRLLRLFRILKMGRYVEESGILMKALKLSRPKITIFILAMVFITTIVGSLMYVIEGPENGYVNIPTSIYWAVTTFTTVGFGDITPQTSVGKFMASLLMLSAYGVLAVPTGIITYELAQASRRPVTTRTCPHCLYEGLSQNAIFCDQCGERIES